MRTVVQTRYFGPTDNKGSRVKVTNLRGGAYKWHHWDYAIGHGPEQHMHAVRQCVAGVVSIEYGGEDANSYYWIVEKEGL